MRDFVIMSDVNCDVEPDYAAEKGIPILPQYYHFNDGVIYGDEIKLTPQQFYDRLAKDRAYSMGCNPDRVRGIMKDALKEDKDILAVMASSECSGSWSTVKGVAEELMEEYPGAKIYVLDTYLEAAASGLLVYMAQDMKEAGKSLDEIICVLEEKKKHIDVYFIVDHLDYLVRGGRLSPLSGAVGSMLQIKPILHFENGKIVPLMKCHGQKAAKKAVLDLISQKKLDRHYYGAAHTNNKQQILNYLETVKAVNGIEPLFVSEVSLIIGVHVGPDAMAIVFCEE